MPAPETMIHPETGALLRRRKRREVVAYMDLTRVVQVTAPSSSIVMFPRSVTGRYTLGKCSPSKRGVTSNLI